MRSSFSIVFKLPMVLSNGSLPTPQDPALSQLMRSSHFQDTGYRSKLPQIQPLHHHLYQRLLQLQTPPNHNHRPFTPPNHLPGPQASSKPIPISCPFTYSATNFQSSPHHDYFSRKLYY